MALRNKLIQFYPLLFQLMRFGLVGLCAAAVHISLLAFFVEIGQLKPLIANIIAFIIAFQVSYWGHRIWTFNGTTASHRVALPRLFLVCGTGFIANEGLFYVFLTVFNLPYPIAQFFVLSILPLVSFTMGKFWVFK